VLSEGVCRVIFALIAAVVGVGLSFAVGAPMWSQALAAALALGAAILLYTWLPLAWKEWRHKWAWRLAVVGLLGVGAATTLLVGIASKTSINYAAHGTLILFDTSAGMLEQLEDGTSKSEVAVETLLSQLQGRDTQQLGLATFGNPDCSADPEARIRVPIAKARTDSIKDSVSESAFSGTRNLVSAGRWALGTLADFINTRQLIVIASGLDECGLSYEELAAQASATEAALEVSLIGLGWTADEKQDFRAKYPATRATFVTTTAEAESALSAILERSDTLSELFGETGDGCRGRDFGGANLQFAVLRGLDCTGVDLRNAILAGADLRGANLAGAYLVGADLTDAVLIDADLTGATLLSADLAGAQLQGATLDDADLRGLDFRNIAFDVAWLRIAKVSGVNLSGLDLRGANLAGAYLVGADLTDAVLIDADLTGATLLSADLAGAQLQGATLDDADLRGLDFRNIGYSSVTRWPSGFDPSTAIFSP
jgi:uncharacterized protein YjbI with pentapeptide repeats